MLTRRDFLAGSLSVAGTFGIPAVSPCRAKSRAAVNPLDFGAVGDGVTDDAPALVRTFAYAFDKGIPLDGGDYEYGVSGNMTVSAKTRPHIKSLRLRQLSPATGRVTLNLSNCQQVQIDSFHIDVGNAPALGEMNGTMGVLVHGGAGHKVNNIKATGNGQLSYVAFWNCTESTFENVHVHDGIFDNAAATDDLVQGIWIHQCTNCSLINPIVRNLTGNASNLNTSGVPTVFPNLRTRGITMGGNQSIAVRNPQITNVDQSIDITGSDGNIDCQVIGGKTTNCASVGVKFANTAVRCKAIGHIAENVGMYGFFAAGPAGPGMVHKTMDCDFIGCTAINPGYNHIEADRDDEPFVHSGFAVMYGDADLDYPKGIRFIDCRAIDNQTAKTMRYGFYNEPDYDPTAKKPNTIGSGCESIGHTIAFQKGFDTHPAAAR